MILVNAACEAEDLEVHERLGAAVLFALLNGGGAIPCMMILEGIRGFTWAVMSGSGPVKSGFVMVCWFCTEQEVRCDRI